MVNICYMNITRIHDPDSPDQRRIIFPWKPIGLSSGTSLQVPSRFAVMPPCSGPILMSGIRTNVWYQAARTGLTFAHELGHIFGLRDKYHERAPYTTDHETNGFKNRNADFRNPYTIPCIMKNNRGFSDTTPRRNHGRIFQASCRIQGFS